MECDGIDCSAEPEMMRDTEYVVVAPGTEKVLERVSGELIRRHTYVEALWMAEQGDQESLNALEAAVIEPPSGGGI
jgi:hypothetical protein